VGGNPKETKELPKGLQEKSEVNDWWTSKYSR
jgi:hypothetical protein